MLRGTTWAKYFKQNRLFENIFGEINQSQLHYQLVSKIVYIRAIYVISYFECMMDPNHKCKELENNLFNELSD